MPAESFNGHHVKITNTSSAEDDYYLEYEAYNGTRGKGFWKEAVARDASPGLDAATMPYQLENTGATTFIFKQWYRKSKKAKAGRINVYCSYYLGSIVCNLDVPTWSLQLFLCLTV